VVEVVVAEAAAAVEVSEVSDEEAGRLAASVVDKLGEELLCAWAAAMRAFMELMGSLGSKALRGIPASWAAAKSAVVLDEVVEDGLDRFEVVGGCVKELWDERREDKSRGWQSPLLPNVSP